MARLKMKRLKKSLWGIQYRAKCFLWDLRVGQMAPKRSMTAKNAGWYNINGEKMGWGDLSTNNFRRISQELEDDELFIVLREGPSYMDFHYPREWNPSPKGGEHSPGIRYVMKHAAWIIAKGRIYNIVHFPDETNKWSSICKVRYKNIHLDVAKKLVKDLREKIMQAQV